MFARKQPLSNKWLRKQFHIFHSCYTLWTEICEINQNFNGDWIKFCFFFCLFDLILYVPSTIFQLNRDGSSWVEPVLSKDKCVLLNDHNAVTPVRLKPAAPWSLVKHSTTEPLRSHMDKILRFTQKSLRNSPKITKKLLFYCKKLVINTVKCDL